jgi:hypothetical protein
MDVSAHQLNAILKKRFGVEVDFTCTAAELRDIMEHYTSRREMIVEEMGNNAAVISAEYVKYHLISEAVRMFLKEIAPRRINKQRKK